MLFIFIYLVIQVCIKILPFVDPPFSPLDLKVVEYNTDYMVLSWKAPEHDGGSSLQGYTVEKRDTFMNMWSQAGKVDKDTLGIRITGLFEGQSYLYRVAAENQCGRGEYAETAKPVTAKLPYGQYVILDISKS
jgi:titin